MDNTDTIRFYSDHASEFSSAYESLAFEDVHKSILDLVPQAPAFILDVGAGSGRDAAWFAGRGCDVIAIEPSVGMLEEARRIHPEPQIRWLQDKLPGLEKTIKLGLSFDLILVNAVWMHINPIYRHRAFRKLVSLLKPAGMIILSLRHGTLDDERENFPVSVDEIEHLALQNGIALRRIRKSEDYLGRADVTWDTVCLQLPDDGTEALPLLRHTILNDSKSSTYKLALLRILVRIADSATGFVRDAGDDYVSIPLGLVALYWIRMYKPLIEAGIPQMPANRDQRGLAFVRESFTQLSKMSPYDLRVGACFSGQDAQWLRQSLIDARNTIQKMPAHYITYPNSSEQVFKAVLTGNVPRGTSFVLNNEYLSSFGELRIPRHIWLAMSRFALWIEPALVAEWIRLMQAYSLGHWRDATYDELMQALTWLEPDRDTALVRSVTERFLQQNVPLFCVWSGKPLESQNLDIDHCFPFSAFPCGDLWNLMPTNRRINQHQKRDKLVTALTLSAAKDRICDWWERAYIDADIPRMRDRFFSEVCAALPMDDTEKQPPPLESIFEGVLLKRANLKRNLQLPDWELNS